MDQQSFGLLFMLFLLIVWLACPLACAGVNIFVIAKSIVSYKKGASGIKIICSSITFICVIVAILSCFLNFGWIRYFLVLFGIPFTYSSFFAISNYTASNYVKKSVTLKISLSLSYITYMIGFMFLPDGGDYGGPYAFFSLIKNEAVIHVLDYIAPIALVLNLACLVYQIVKSVKIKNSMEQNNAEASL